MPLGVERLGGYANGFASTTSQWLAASGAADMGGDPALHALPPNSMCPVCASEYDNATSIITSAAYCGHAACWAGAEGEGELMGELPHDEASVGHSATIVGGCCGIGAAHMKAVARKLRPEQA